MISAHNTNQRLIPRLCTFGHNNLLAKPQNTHALSYSLLSLDSGRELGSGMGKFSRFDLVARAAERADQQFTFVIGIVAFVVMAGPCAVESEWQLLIIAEAVADAGAQVLRGGAFKLRSSLYSFQGLG